MCNILVTTALQDLPVEVLNFTQAYLNAPLVRDTWTELLDKKAIKADRAFYGLQQSAVEDSTEPRNT